MPTERFNFWPKLGIMKVKGEIQVGVSTFFKRPLRFSQMERHLKSQEIMIPLTGTVLIPFRTFDNLDPSGKPFSDNIEVFEVDKQHGVILNSGIWHWTPMPLEDETSIVVIFETGTETNDLYIQNFPNEDIVNVEI